MREAFEKLLAAFGPQGWWPADSDDEVVVGAVLTQAVSWSNVERAIAHLRQAGLLTLAALARADPATVVPLIRPAGYFNVKARKLQAVARFVVDAGGVASLRRWRPDELRRALLGVFGIGPETADAILCYALGQPCFVADAYARRIAGRVGWLPGPSGYEAARRVFEPALTGVDPGEFHALLVRLAKHCCHRRRPDCAVCPLRGDCAFAVRGILVDEVDRGSRKHGAQ